MPELLTKAFEMIANGNSLIALLLALVAVLVYTVHYFITAYNDLRKTTSETIDKLQGQLGDLNNDYSESNSKSAETLQKIAETLVTLSGQIGKK